LLLFFAAFFVTTLPSDPHSIFRTPPPPSKLFPPEDLFLTSPLIRFHRPNQFSSPPWEPPCGMSQMFCFSRQFFSFPARHLACRVTFFLVTGLVHFLISSFLEPTFTTFFFFDWRFTFPFPFPKFISSSCPTFAPEASCGGTSPQSAPRNWGSYDCGFPSGPSPPPWSCSQPLPPSVIRTSISSRQRTPATH